MNRINLLVRESLMNIVAGTVSHNRSMFQLLWPRLTEQESRTLHGRSCNCDYACMNIYATFNLRDLVEEGLKKDAVQLRLRLLLLLPMFIFLCPFEQDLVALFIKGCITNPASKEVINIDKISNGTSINFSKNGVLIGCNDDDEFDFMSWVITVNEKQLLESLESKLPLKNIKSKIEKHLLCHSHVQCLWVKKQLLSSMNYHDLMQLQVWSTKNPKQYEFGSTVRQYYSQNFSTRMLSKDYCTYDNHCALQRSGFGGNFKIDPMLESIASAWIDVVPKFKIMQTMLVCFQYNFEFEQCSIVPFDPQLRHFNLNSKMKNEGFNVLFQVVMDGPSIEFVYIYKFKLCKRKCGYYYWRVLIEMFGEDSVSMYGFLNTIPAEGRLKCFYDDEERFTFKINLPIADFCVNE